MTVLIVCWIYLWQSKDFIQPMILDPRSDCPQKPWRFTITSKPWLNEQCWQIWNSKKQPNFQVILWHKISTVLGWHISISNQKTKFSLSRCWNASISDTPKSSKAWYKLTKGSSVCPKDVLGICKDRELTGFNRCTCQIQAQSRGGINGKKGSWEELPSFARRGNHRFSYLGKLRTSNVRRNLLFKNQKSNSWKLPMGQLKYHIIHQVM